MNIDDKQALVDAVKRLAGLVDAIDVDPVPEPKRPVVLGTWDHSRSVDGVTGVDTEMAALVGRPRTVNGFRRGYTSGGHPVSFADSPVRWAESTWGHAAMLNTKNHGDYDTALAGGFDDLWAGYWRSVPVGVRLWQTWQHEPENDRGIDADKWCRAVGRYVNVAAPIIRERGLDAGVGGLLMGYTKPAEVQSRWAWWEHVDPENLPQTVFMVDQYAKHLTPDKGEDLAAMLEERFDIGRAAGITRFVVGETAISLEKRNAGGQLIGSPESQAAWLRWQVPKWRQIDGLEAVCYFHTQRGPASKNARLSGPSLGAWAEFVAGVA